MNSTTRRAMLAAYLVIAVLAIVLIARYNLRWVSIVFWAISVGYALLVHLSRQNSLER